MKRRDGIRREILIAAGLVIAVPRFVVAQPKGRVSSIGFLGVGSASTYAYRLDALRAGLRDLGYVEGKNIAIEYRWAEWNNDRLLGMAKELIGLNVALIVTHANAGARAARQATASVPIVITDIADAVASGVVENLARPSGNVTGSTFFGPQLSAKRLELLKEVLPRLERAALLINPGTEAFVAPLRETEAAAKSMKVDLQRYESRQAEDFEEAFAAMARNRVEAVLIQDEPLFTPNRKALAMLANRHRIPSAGYSEFAEAGGMIGYGLNFLELYRRAAYFVDKILNGAKPADIPMEQATRFELVVNLQAARALGVAIPQSVTLRADKVVE